MVDGCPSRRDWGGVRGQTRPFLAQACCPTRCPLAGQGAWTAQMVSPPPAGRSKCGRLFFFSVLRKKTLRCVCKHDWAPPAALGGGKVRAACSGTASRGWRCRSGGERGGWWVLEGAPGAASLRSLSAARAPAALAPLTLLLLSFSPLGHPKVGHLGPGRARRPQRPVRDQAVQAGVFPAGRHRGTV